MTKSNKTLLCCLLACVMVLACALTLLPIATPTTANAAETTYVKVTEELEDWSGEYLIVYENSTTEAYVWNGVDKAVSVITNINSDGGIAIDGAVTIKIEKFNDGYSLKVVGGDNDGKYLSGGAKKNIFRGKCSIKQNFKR